MTKILRGIKSFTLRSGKITPSQVRAIQNYASTYAIEYQLTPIELGRQFIHEQPIIIEIGSGMGETTCEIAKLNPSQNYLAIEVHKPGIGGLIINIQKQALNNIRYIEYDAVAVIKDMIMDNSIAGFHIFFPDPWHKKRHHKRRIIQAEFVEKLVDKLVPNGYIHLATDWQDYALHMLDTLANNKRLVNSSTNGGFATRPISRPITKFETRGLSLGHGVYDIIFTKA